MARIDVSHFINLKGEKLITDFLVIKTQEYHEGLAAVKTAKYWEYMDRLG
jgi:hypothetical protein